MPDYSRQPIGPLVYRIDPESGQTVAVEDHNGRELGLPFLTLEQATPLAALGENLTTAGASALTAMGALSGVSYDTSSRAIAWTIDGTNYTASYSASEIVVTGSDSTITRIALDPNSRITAVSPQ